ncbi:MAG TPA: hypothetical protein VEW46_22675 [Pyrinomonadaceae bacterium]|nr:hypothetical protein [Pyrinomonadaceae bacterium]
MPQDKAVEIAHQLCAGLAAVHAVAGALLAAVFVGLALVMLASGKVALHRLIPLKKSPDALKERADEIARRVGYDAPPADTAHGSSLDGEHLLHLRNRDTSPDRWNRLATGQPPVVSFWYRHRFNRLSSSPSSCSSSLCCCGTNGWASPPAGSFWPPSRC